MDSQYANQARVDIMAGGGFQDYARVSRAHVVTVFDNQQEVSAIPDRPNLIKIPLGGDDTVLSMLTRLSAAKPDVQPLLAEYEQRNNIHLGSGMAQDPRLGACVIQDLDVRGELEPIFEEMFIRVLEAVNGSLGLLVVHEFNSNAGGMGAGGAPEIGARFCAYAAQYTTAKIRRRMMRLGGLTYAPLSWRTIRNTRDVTRDNLAFMVDGPIAVRELRDLELYELPLRSEAGDPIRDKQRLRSQLAATLAQARYTDCVNDGLNLREINEIPASRFGGMLRGLACWSHMLDPEALVRAAAAHCRQQLKALRQHPEPAAMDLVERLEVALTPRGHTLPTVDDIMALLSQPQGAHAVRIDEAVRADPQRFDATVWIYTAQAQSIALHDLLHAPERPASLAALCAHRQRLRGLLAHLEQAREAAQQAVAVQTRSLHTHRQAMHSTLRRLRSFRRYLDAMMQSAMRVKRGVQARWEAYASAHARHSEAVARLEVLSAAVAQVAETLERYEWQWLGRIETGLETVVGTWGLALGSVAFAPLEVFYSDLLDATLPAITAAASGKMEKARAILRPVLLDAVSHVTLEGLAQMLETTAEAGAIITALADERFAYRAPLWGGASTHVPPRYHYVILPPVAAADLAALTQAAAERHFTPSLAPAASAVAAVAS